ncbi:MAG: hypothetical protein K6T31_08275 [Alicyclobacillus sp.]|nr:hypothetical protein [Alicyclobacillus sp.]
MSRAVSLLGAGAACAAILGLAGCAPDLSVGDDLQPLQNAAQVPPAVRQVLQTKATSGETVGGFVDGFAKTAGLSTYYDTHVFGDVTVVEVVLQKDNGVPVMTLVFGVKAGQVVAGDQPSEDLLSGNVPAAYADLMAAVSGVLNSENAPRSPIYLPHSIFASFASRSAASEASGALDVGHAETVDGAHAGGEVSVGHGGAAR